MSGQDERFIIDVDIEEVANEIRKAASEAENEPQLTHDVEYILRSRVLDRLDVPWGRWLPPKAKYEATLISGVRPDVLYGHVVIEYERPGKFNTPKGFEDAVEQVKMYIIEHSQHLESRWPKYFGVVLDGFKIGFVRYREVLKGFESKGPFDVNRSTIARLIEAIIGLRRKALNANNLLGDFGPQKTIAQDAIKIFYEKLRRTTPRTEVLFKDWKRVFSQVCNYDPKKLEKLEETYDFLGKNIDYERLLFSLHTYFALIMKLIAAEVAALYVAPRIWSYLKALEDAYYRGHENLRDELRELEEGGIFVKLGITNFLEADYFAWYLDEWDEHVAKSVAKIVRGLSDYDPSAAELDPERVKDLFKRLYQNLAPQKVRHDLGEYYTPDWLAELTLNEVGWTFETFEKKAEESGNRLGPLDLRFLDPACGSGTFLVLAISRLRKYVEEHWIDKGVALRRITKNIVGFDLNPLAVIASRTNYLIALGDMLREKGAEPIEIPVYLADSIMVEQRPTVYGTKAYVLKTVVGEFSVPIRIVEENLLNRALLVLEECVKSYSMSDFKARLMKEANLEEQDLSLMIGLFETLKKLESEGKNKIWLRVLKNSFAPLFVGKFDYVVGNPPWVLWDNLPIEYRNSIKPLWQNYGLFTLSGSEARHGGGKKDISILFTYTCVDKYLKDQGRFGFLITQSVFKTKGAGEGFRRFKLRDGPLKVVKVHDFVLVKPFEGANNRTSAIFLEKKGETRYPITYVLWRPKETIEQTDAINDAFKKTEIIEMLAKPASEKDTYSPWLTLPKKALEAVQKALGKSYYKCYAGIYSGGANAVYWFRIIDLHGEKDVDINVPLHLRKIFGEKIRRVRYVYVENVTEGMKKKIKSISTVLEDFFLYPLIKSQHIEKWRINGYIYTLQMQDPIKRVGYDEHWVKINFPKTYEHLKSFEALLLNRAAFKKYMSARDVPFYTMYDLGGYTYASYKVVWNQMGNKLMACVVSSANDKFLGNKLILPEHVLAFIPTDNEDEAHYLCAILNSSIADLVLRSIAGGTKSFGTPKMIEETLNIPRYNAKNVIHTRLVVLSKKAHQIASTNNIQELAQIEGEIDKTVAKLYGINDDELTEIKNTLKLLEGEEIEEETMEEIPTLEPDLTITNPVITENQPAQIEITVTNSSEEPITNVKIKAQLPNKKVEELFQVIEKQEKLKAQLEALPKGEYKIRITMEYNAKGEAQKIEKTLTLFVKSSEGRKPIERGEIDELFGD
jgi:hypothetical protein